MNNCEDTVDMRKNEVFSFQLFEFPEEVSFATKINTDTTILDQKDKGCLVVLVINGKDSASDIFMFNAQGEGSLEKSLLQSKTAHFHPPCAT